MRTEEYSADTIWKMIQNKRLLIDSRNYGSYCAADMLMDCEIYEKRFLSDEQRKIVRNVFEKEYTVKQTAHILHKTCSDVKFLIRSIPQSLKERMP